MSHSYSFANVRISLPIGKAICVALLVSCCVTHANDEHREVKNQDRVRELQPEQLQLVDQLRRQIAALKKSIPPSVSEQTGEQKMRLRQLEDLLREIQKRLETYQNGTSRTHYVSLDKDGPDIRSYYENVRQRVLEEGVKNPPTRRGKPIYGAVTILVMISRDGTVDKIEILKSSSPELSKNAVLVAKSLQPFEPFPTEVGSNIDTLGVIFNFNYVK